MIHRRLDEYQKQIIYKTSKQQATKSRYKITEFYKETKFQETSMRKIPKEWKIVKLGSLFTFKNGKRPHKILESNIVPIYGANGIMGYTNTALLDRDYVIIIGRVGASGKVHLARGKIWVSDNAIYSESYDKNNIYPIFAYFFLSFTNLERFASKTTHPIIKQSFLRELRIPLPTLEEQWGIAEVLSTLDRAIEATEKLIQRLERLKRGLMQELLTKGIGHKEFKETPIGKIPKEWSITKLRNVAKINESKINMANLEGEIARIPMELIPDNGIYANYVLMHIDEIKSYIIAKAGDILLAKITPSFENGKQGIVPNNVPYGIALVTTEVYPITPNNIERTFLFYLLKWRKYRKLLEWKMTGTTGRKRIPKNALENLLIPLPSLEEQKRIAAILSSIDDWIELERKRKEKLERLKRGLMDLLLTGRIRVRVERLDDTKSSSISGEVANP